MASAKEYGYFIKGQKLALIEKDTALDNDVNSRDYGPDVTNVRFKSPQSSVTGGIELEYIYSPKYRINQSSVLVNYFPVAGWTTINGYVSFVSAVNISGSTSVSLPVDWTSSPYNSTTSGTRGDTGGLTQDFILVRNSSQWNGLHKIQTASANGYIQTYTKSNIAMNGAFETDLDFEASTKSIYNADTNAPALWMDNNFSVGDKVFISGSSTDSGLNNGIYEITSLTAGTTAGRAVLGKKFAFSSTTTTWDTIEETEIHIIYNETDQTDITLLKLNYEPNTKIYTDVDILNDESDELPISEYLSKAVVYYLKAKMAEDRGDFNLKQVMMREFYRIVEKSDNAKIHTIRRVAPHSAAIR